MTALVIGDVAKGAAAGLAAGAGEGDASADGLAAGAGDIDASADGLAAGAGEGDVPSSAVAARGAHTIITAHISNANTGLIRFIVQFLLRHSVVCRYR